MKMNKEERGFPSHTSSDSNESLRQIWTAFTSYFWNNELIWVDGKAENEEKKSIEK